MIILELIALQNVIVEKINQVSSNRYEYPTRRTVTLLFA